MTPEQLSAAVVAAVRTAAESGALAVTPPEHATVERPKQREHGDYATNVALQLAKPAGRPPREVAETIAAHLRETAGIAKVDVAGPGFLNITLDSAAQGELARTVLAAGTDYGRSDALHGTSINLEFISANPTGPLHLGHMRWAAVGDAMARVLQAAGAQVTREFYINDLGSQMDHFGASIMAAAHDEPTPENGYHGEYVTELAKEIVTDRPEILDLAPEEQLVAFREEGYARQLAEQQQVLEVFRTHFDVWASERALHESGAVARNLDKLRSLGHTYTSDGAEWLRTTDFGDDKDRVLVRSNGVLTYFASDIAYYLDKRERGAEICIYLLGADHHGYVRRLETIAVSAGDRRDQCEVLIGQMVKIMQGGEELRLSKRAGTIVTIREIVELTGVDAARYSLIRYPTDSPITLDVDVVTRQTNDNPVFYVQYGHARIAAVLRNAGELGVDRGPLEAFDPALLTHEKEGELLGALGEFPRVVATAAELREPHRVARYLEELAGTFHRFYDACRVLPRGDEETTDLHRARLALVEATSRVFANGLDLLGVAAPDRM